MAACCFSPCRQAYKRHVDAIYPAVAEEGIVKIKMESLMYFAMTSPEKLDRIGEYLAHRISRDIGRNGRKEFVFIGLDAMDQLLASACHVRTLNLFVESFLKTIQKLLESNDPDMQIKASESFLRFSKLEEDTPCYHRSYDFFISRFASMCTSSHPDEGTRTRLRISGLEGLSGVIRKTVNEDLAENIWEITHMQKIVGSLLFNLLSNSNINQDLNLENDQGGPVTLGGRGTPDPLGTGKTVTASDKADQILRELVTFASTISDIKAILGPVLRHMDDNQIWLQKSNAGYPSNASVYTFTAIMYSVQTDISHVVIEEILSHIDSSTTTSTSFFTKNANFSVFPVENFFQFHVFFLIFIVPIKTRVADVLARIIGIGVGDSTVGPAVLEIINSLLKHLNASVKLGRKYEEPGSRAIQDYQSALLRALGEYTSKMPDFQKTENMTFILTKIPTDQQQHLYPEFFTDVQHIFMKALFSVAEKHTSTLFSSTFSTGR